MHEAELIHTCFFFCFSSIIYNPDDMYSTCVPQQQPSTYYPSPQGGDSAPYYLPFDMTTTTTTTDHYYFTVDPCYCCCYYYYTCPQGRLSVNNNNIDCSYYDPNLFLLSPTTTDESSSTMISADTNSSSTVTATATTTAADARPYPCNRCPRSFARKHDLQRHLRVHTGAKPYFCVRCKKAFARSDALKRHVRKEDLSRTSPEIQALEEAGRRRRRNIQEPSPRMSSCNYNKKWSMTSLLSKTVDGRLSQIW